MTESYPRPNEPRGGKDAVPTMILFSTTQVSKPTDQNQPEDKSRCGKKLIRLKLGKTWLPSQRISVKRTMKIWKQCGQTSKALSRISLRRESPQR